MSISDIIRRSGRNLRQSKARTVLTALAIGVGAFALTLTLAASNGAKSFVDGIIKDNFNPAELIVVKDKETLEGADTKTPKEYSEDFSAGTSGVGARIQIKKLNDEDIHKIQQIEGVEEVRLGSVVNLKYITREGQKKYIATIAALDPFMDVELVAGKAPGKLGDNQLIIPDAWLSALGFQDAQDAIGKPLTLAAQKTINPADILADVQSGGDIHQLLAANQSDATSQEEFTIVGVMAKPSAAQQPGTQLYLYGGEKDVQRLLEVGTKGTPEFRRYTNVFVRIKDGENEAKLKAAQERVTNAGYASMSIKETQEFLNQAINVLQGIVVAFSFIAVIASLFGVINTMYISVIQRTREIGLMKALGMRGRDVSRLFRFEAAWIGFLGGAIGSGLAYLLGLVLNPWITENLELGAGNTLLEFHLSQTILLIIGLVVVAVVAGFFPARKAAKLDPIEALRTE